jgi:hypothetical protein
MTDALPNATWSGTLTVSGVELRCHVLDTGQRIIETESLERLFRAWGSGVAPAPTEQEMADYARWAAR